MFNKLINKYKEELKEKEEYDYSCAMAELDKGGKVAKSVIEYVKSIPDEDLYVEEDKYGRELDPHVTILYGLHSNDLQEIYDSLELEDVIKATLGKLTFFENDKYNVLKIDVKSEDLKKLNKKLTDNMEYTSDFPDYHAHMTIAYLNKDADKSKYLNNGIFDGIDVTFPLVKISGSDDMKKTFKIKGKD